MMHRTMMTAWAFCSVGLLGLPACSEEATSGGQTAEQQPVERDDGVPSRVPDTLPREHRHPLTDVASIVSAVVSSVSETFDDRLGPRQVYVLENITVYAGKPLPTQTFSQLGGDMPDGRSIDVSDMPQFEVGQRYVFFFARQASLFTPVWSNLSFRVAARAGREFVLGESGRAITSFAADRVDEGTTNFLADDQPTALQQAAQPGAWQGTIKNGDPKADPPLSHADIALDPGTPQAQVSGRIDLARAAIVPTEFEQRQALTVATFGAAAREAARAVGATFADEVSLDPPLDVRWNGSMHAENH